MHWKLKATVQNVVSLLPESFSYGLYYRLQRTAGALRRINPTSRLEAGVTTWRRLLEAGAEPVGKTFFEIGTGRMVTIPLAYWLMGAGRTVTVDLNPYLKSELVLESLRFMASHPQTIRDLFGGLLDEDRFDQVTRLAATDHFDLPSFLDLIGVEYHAPADAAATGLPAESIDFHTSYTVMEHIPPEVLAAILTEGRRLLRPGGVSIHGIDYSDHFSHNDPSITAVNFLQFSPEDWDRWAGNRYMYMNRLRHSDYLDLFEGSSLRVDAQETTVNDRSLEALRSGAVKPHAPFADAPADELAITSSWIVARAKAA